MKTEKLRKRWKNQYQNICVLKFSTGTVQAKVNGGDDVDVFKDDNVDDDDDNAVADGGDDGGSGGGKLSIIFHKTISPLFLNCFVQHNKFLSFQLVTLLFSQLHCMKLSKKKKIKIKIVFSIYKA